MRRKFFNLVVGLVVLGLFGFILVGMGCDSVVIPGPPGPAGPSGSPGLDAGSELPRTVVTILDVNDGGPVEPGRLTAVTFTITTGDGDPISIDDLDRFSIYVSGPSNNYTRVILPEGDLENNVIAHGDGTYTYTFADPFPDTYAAPANDSDAFGPTDNELMGTVAAGSYTVAIEARRTFALEGESIRDAGDATFDFGVGGAPVMPRQVVLESSCEQCHAQLTLHGQNRFSVTGCVLCHTNGAEDRISSDPAKETPGVSIQFANMIHRIHRGAGLPSVKATENSSDPYRYEVIGFGETVHDYSDVQFPVMPGGTGFNEQTRNCGACHDGAAQGVQAHTNPSQAACSGCHDDIDWDAGTRLDHSDPDVMAGTLTRDQLSDPNFRELFLGALVHNFNDGQCSQCHNPQSPSLDSAVVHVPPLADEANTIGLEVVVQSVEGQSGAVFFQPGDFPVVTFQLLDRLDNPVDIGEVSSVNLVISGPVENYQHLIPAAGSTVSLKGSGGVPTSGTGPFTYASSEAIPPTYPAPLGDSPAFDFAGGWGELSGLSLDNGSYTVMVYAYREFEVAGTSYRETSPPGLFQIRVGSAGTVSAYPGYVTDTTCNACHGDLLFHGNTRKGVESCVLCHTGGAEDRMNPLPGQMQDPVADSIDWKILIHKIHNARELDVVETGGTYDLIGFAFGQPPDTGNVIDFSTGLLPTMPEEAKHCTACHAADAWKAPVERTDVNIWKVACTSCHDSHATAVHVQLNTLGVGQEACATCHGEGAFFSIETAHRIR